jgi:mannose/fructose-specific phosphotransferase system component IIA
MSEGVRGVVIAHGSLAAALVGEAERISGERGALLPVSNDDCGREEIEARVAAAIGPGAAVIFVDMPCGSCFLAAMKQTRNRPDVRVVTGVNLPMLLDFVHNRTLPPADGAARAAGKGTDAIRQA